MSNQKIKGGPGPPQRRLRKLRRLKIKLMEKLVYLIFAYLVRDRARADPLLDVELNEEISDVRLLHGHLLVYARLTYRLVKLYTEMKPGRKTVEWLALLCKFSDGEVSPELQEALHRHLECARAQSL